ncbi:hypothetical protein [Pseudarthrobacter sp. Y6]|uniref:hypothetical protein n=1 Tax=Pseudarthrobacter sp. Y6 TaxID=3418422 RepID=UPI003CE8CC3A
MAAVSLRQILSRRVGRPGSSAQRRDVPEQDASRLSMGTRLDASDPYWWILAGGIHVPGFGAYAEASDK